MKRVLIPAAVAAVLLSAALLRAQDAITIKVKDVAQGDVYKVDKTESADIAIKLTDAAGKVQDLPGQKTNEKYAYTETVITCEAKKSPTKLERKYEKAEATGPDGKKKDLPFQGKTVMIEQKKDSKWSFTVDGKELTGADAEGLKHEFDNKTDDKEIEKALLPKQPVKVDGSWKVDMAPLLKEMNKSGDVEVDADKAKGTATLVKAYKKDDRQYGVIKVTLTLPLKSVGQGDKKVKAEEGSLATVDMNLDACIDGTENTAKTTGGMKMEVKAVVPTPEGGKAPVTTTVTTKSEETHKDLSKK